VTQLGGRVARVFSIAEAVGTTGDGELAMLDEAGPAVLTRPGPSFDAFYAAAFPALVVQLHAFIGNRAEAQDVVQEAFVRAWPRWDRIAGYDDPVAWVRRVAWNLATSRWRRARTALTAARRQRMEPVAGPEPDHVDLARALSTLPPGPRRALILFHVAGLSVAEIALDSEVAEGTVKSWLHRARGALARQLSDS
jgi:RNA polymerase sigma-70 factor (ECF subfamily)